MSVNFLLKIILFFLAIISLFFIDNGNPFVELFLKLGYIVTLSFYYVYKTKKINHWYVLVLFFYGISSSLLAFDVKYIVQGTFFLLLTRLLYIIISRRAFSIENSKKLTMFILVFSVPIIIIFPQLKPSLQNLTYPILTIGFLSAIMCSFAFVNYFKKMTKSNCYFTISMLLFVIADVLIVYNQFINYSFVFVLIYTSIYYISRYVLCEAIIMESA